MPIITNQTVANPDLAYGLTGGIVPQSIDAAIPVEWVGNIISRLKIIQVAGFIPVSPCVSDECRDFNDICYQNVVLATLSGDDKLENDKSAFLFEAPLFKRGSTLSDSNLTFHLQENIDDIWYDIATLNNNAYGTYYAFQSFVIDYWKGYLIDWSKVLNLQGEGTYRFKVLASYYGESLCYASEAFVLKTYTCDRADCTVRFEATVKGGKLGSIDDPNKLFSFCKNTMTTTAAGSVTITTSISWYDSIRLPGFFGNEKSTYEKLSVEYANGQINNIRNKTLQRYEWLSGLLPKYIHDRLKAYGFMADELLVSDYNEHNADYDIKKKAVFIDSGYEPNHNPHTRLANVKAEFVEAIQNVIRSKCC